VLDEAGRPIPGLFAAGETSSGVLGEAYIGSGSSVAHVITFGRVAGRSAAAQAMAEA
jgi:fumarate reductase flavoprotein subunit